MASKTQVLAAKLAGAKCQPPDIKDLTPRQQHALHLFKFEVLASLQRLYMEVPREQADALVDTYLD